MTVDHSVSITLDSAAGMYDASDTTSFASGTPCAGRDKQSARPVARGKRRATAATGGRIPGERQPPAKQVLYCYVNTPSLRVTVICNTSTWLTLSVTSVAGPRHTYIPELFLWTPQARFPKLWHT